MKNIEKIKPNSLFCNYIFKSIPLAFDESLSYYECLCGLLSYLKNTIIPVIDNNADFLEETSERIYELYNELKDYVDNYFDNLDLQYEINNKLDEMAQSGELASILQSFQINKTHIDIINKTNLLDNAEWNIPNGWHLSDGIFTHEVGSNESLTTNIEILNYACYVLKFTCTNQYANNANPPLIVEFSESGTFEQYNGNGTVTKYFTFYPTNNNGLLKFTPNVNWSGEISDIKLVKIENNELLKPTLNIYDENNQSSFSTIINNKEMNNITLSNNALQKATYGATKNIAIGNNTLDNTATGYFNVAIGENSQHNSINGSRNIGVGYASLSNLTNGDRNVGIGTFALNGVTNGRNNIGIGADAGWHTTTGSNNISIGSSALDSNTTGSSNIALGYLTNSRNITGSDNISIGHFSHYKGSNDSHNVAIGWQTMMGSNRTDGDAIYTNNIAIGYETMFNPKGNNNVAIGYNALKSPTNNTNRNVAIGYDVMSSTVTTTGDGNNIVVGMNAGKKIAGTNNIVLGSATANGVLGSNNIAIGRAVLANTTGDDNISIGNTSGNALSSGTNNILIGNRAGLSITTASNCIIIGANKNGRNVDGTVIIGNAIEYNDSTKKLSFCGVGNAGNAFVNIPTGTNENAPIRLNSGTLMTTPGSGCIEYDGNHLYFTDSSNNRHEIAVVS